MHTHTNANQAIKNEWKKKKPSLDNAEPNSVPIQILQEFGNKRKKLYRKINPGRAPTSV